MELQVHLRNGVVREDGSIRDITNSSRLDHVADGESLDRLVLRSATSAVGAADGLDVAAALLVAAVVRPLLDHFDGFLCDEGSEEEWEYVGGRGGDCRVLGCRE